MEDRSTGRLVPGVVLEQGNPPMMYVWLDQTIYYPKNGTYSERFVEITESLKDRVMDARNRDLLSTLLTTLTRKAYQYGDISTDPFSFAPKVEFLVIQEEPLFDVYASIEKTFQKTEPQSVPR